MSPSTSDDEAEDLSRQAAALRLQAKRKGMALDQLRSAHAKAVLRQAKAEAEERRRQVMAERDQVAKDLKDRYPTLAAELAALLARVMASEVACKAVNVPGPEATARGLGPQDVGRLTRTVILPAFDLQDHKMGRHASWPPSRPRSSGSLLPQAALERSAELGDMARATQEANLRQEARVRGVGPIPPEAELVPAVKPVH